MTLELTGAPASRAAPAFWSKIVGLFATWNEARRDGDVLVYLGELDDSRLCDLGLTRADIADARLAPSTRILTDRRRSNICGGAGCHEARKGA